MAQGAGALVKQALPQEHGSWSFVAEPLLVAALAGYPWPASLGVFLAFLAYRPLSLAARDLLKRRQYPRTWPFAAAGVFLGSAGAVLVLATGRWPLMVALAVLGAVFAVLDARADRRSLGRELVGAWLAVPAAVLAAPTAWPVLLLRPAVAVLSVRGKLSRMSDSAACRWVAVGLGVAMVACAWVALGAGPRFLAYSVAAGRAVWLAATARQEAVPIRIGVSEGLVALAVVLSWLAGA